jgi:putative Ca2+/H+ antiporter (TMEM165/GDT1 family)
VRPLFSALGLVFVAELGDKTQLVAMSFGARYRFRQVAIGLLLAYVVSSGLAAVVGGLLGAALPERALAIGGGIAFLLFALLALRGDDEAVRETEALPPTRWRSPAAVVAVSVTIAELGDKTQLTTATLAAQNSPLLTWIGATLGLLAAGLLGAVVGRALGDRLPARALRYVSAGLFAVVGVILIVTALW